MAPGSSAGSHKCAQPTHDASASRVHEGQGEGRGLKARKCAGDSEIKAIGLPLAYHSRANAVPQPLRAAVLNSNPTFPVRAGRSWAISGGARRPRPTDHPPRAGVLNGAYLIRISLSQSDLCISNGPCRRDSKPALAICLPRWRLTSSGGERLLHASDWPYNQAIKPSSNAQRRCA
jgi:hypothetical protein